MQFNVYKIIKNEINYRNVSGQVSSIDRSIDQFIISPNIFAKVAFFYAYKQNADLELNTKNHCKPKEWRENLILNVFD